MASAPMPFVARSLASGVATLLASVGLLVGAHVVADADKGATVFFLVVSVVMAALVYAEMLRKERDNLPSASTPPAPIVAPATQASRVVRRAVATLAFSLIVLAAIGALTALLMRVLADDSGVQGFVLVTAVGAGFGLAEAAYGIWVRRWEMRHDVVVYAQRGDSGRRLFAVRAPRPKPGS